MKILVTGVGAIIGQGILKSLREGGLGDGLHGMDIHSHAYGQELCTKFHLAPRADAPDYVERMNGIVAGNGIGFIIPGIEQDLYRLHAERSRIGCPVLLNNDLLIGLSKDKWATYEYFRKAGGIDLIPTLELDRYERLVEKLGSPFIVKPRSSYASKGFHVLANEGEFNLATLHGKEGLIFQKRIGALEGEFTAHVFGDGAGGILDMLIMKRVLAADGSTGVAEFSDDAAVKACCLKLAQVTRPLGPTNFQLIKHEGEALLLEINPRLSSACSIATLMGYNAPMHAVRHFIEKKPLTIRPKSPMKVVRHIEDWVFSKGAP
ncbi:MAG TPA: ATP-grasp domain-containing protein [Bdellovibrionota bacterium]|nr:ATP-grasp domain-containing protein [Bdellovibrionota bacterium]